MIFTLTLNPAVDRLLFIDEFIKRDTLRARESKQGLGGKGTHVSVNLALLGEKNAAFGVCHGQTGLAVIDMLHGYGVDARFIHREGDKETRTNYLIIEGNGDSTIIAEKGVQLTEDDLIELLSLMERDSAQNDILVLSGDASNSPDPAVFCRIMRALRHKSPRVLLDTSGAALSEGVRERPYMIKPNLSELSALCGRPVSEADEDVYDAVCALDMYAIPVIAVTMGADGAFVKTPEGIFRARPPAVNPKNTSGCGDAFLTGMAFGLSRGLPMEETVRTALAVSAATAEEHTSVGFDVSRAKELAEQARVVRLNMRQENI